MPARVISSTHCPNTSDRHAGAVLALAVGASFVWCYLTTLGELADLWQREPDYSHGFLVAPLALWLLWVRRHRRPATAPRPAWGGVVLIALSIVVRVAGSRLLTDSADGYSILLWVAGAVWALAGWRWLCWALPCIAFLGFMVPLPYRLESLLSVPLQLVAARLSAVMLQLLGQPAFASGTTIQLGANILEVERECSGLRIFVGVFALAAAYIIAGRREIWENAVLVASIVPIALLANAGRIVVTGLLYQLVSSEAARRFSHDFAGWLMILFAGGLFALVLWYLGRLLPGSSPVRLSEVVNRSRAQTGSTN